MYFGQSEHKYNVIISLTLTYDIKYIIFWRTNNKVILKENLKIVKLKTFNAINRRIKYRMKVILRQHCSRAEMD